MKTKHELGGHSADKRRLEVFAEPKPLACDSPGSKEYSLSRRSRMCLWSQGTVLGARTTSTHCPAIGQQINYCETLEPSPWSPNGDARVVYVCRLVEKFSELPDETIQPSVFWNLGSHRRRVGPCGAPVNKRSGESSGRHLHVRTACLVSAALARNDSARRVGTRNLAKLRQQ